MGLLAWIKRRRSTSTATSIASTHAAVDEIDHLAHQFLTEGVMTANFGRMIVMPSTGVVVDGQVVSADDPRARERMLKAVSELRVQGFDELADDLERQFGAAAQAANGGPRAAAAPDARPVSPADAPESLSSAEPVGDGGVGAPSAPSPPTPPPPPSGSF